MATPVQARDAIKAKIEQDFPKFISAVTAATDELATGKLDSEIDLNAHARKEKEEVNNLTATWYVQSLGFSASAGTSRKLLIWVEPT